MEKPVPAIGAFGVERMTNGRSVEAVVVLQEEVFGLVVSHGEELCFVLKSEQDQSSGASF